VNFKPVVFGAFLAAAIVQSASAKPVVAPADEYFGRMKLSILGISNTIHDTKLRESYDPAHAADNYSKLLLAEDALEDWAKKYPQDNWLPGKAYYMSHEFWAMNTADGDRAAQRCRAVLLSLYAKSPYSVKARTEVAAMFEPTIAGTAATASVASGTAASQGSAAGATTATSQGSAAGATTVTSQGSAAGATTATSHGSAAGGSAVAAPVPQATGNPHS
jgi:hypothetical protein